MRTTSRTDSPRWEVKLPTSEKILAQHLTHDLRVSHTLVGGMIFSGLTGRDSREASVTEESTLKAVQICTVQCEEDGLCGQFALAAIEIIPGW